VVFLSIGLAIYSWRHRPISGATSLSLLASGVTIWSLAYILELCSASLEMANLWLRIEYFGIVIVPVSWLLLSVEYCGFSKLLTHRNIFLLLVIPLITLLLVWTNNSHHLVWNEIQQKMDNGFLL
jgi:hypothetical protein